MEEVLDTDPRQFTIAKLHEHHFYLETEVLIHTSTLKDHSGISDHNMADSC